MARIILHSDINSCYASIEHALHPEYAGRPLAVGGSEAERHGIILAKDEQAKRCGVQTGMALWQARLLCPDLTILPPRMDVYLDFAQRAQAIYGEYTDLREPFGIDESWLDLTGCLGVTDGIAAATEIRQRIKRELGITVSVGVSWNKVFAKLGSDYRKPDAVTCISPENYRELVWPLPARALLFVGRATEAKLGAVGIRSIGDLARADPELLRRRLGKMGYVLHSYANGLDAAPVQRAELRSQVKSVSNSTTAHRDLVCEEDVRVVLGALTERVAARLRDGGLRCCQLTLSVRGSALTWRSHQARLDRATNSTRALFQTGLALFHQLHHWPAPIRSLGLAAGALEAADAPEQLDLFTGEQLRRQARLDSAMDGLRKKYGFPCVRRGLSDNDLYTPGRDLHIHGSAGGFALH